jgi:biotin transport system substrate-specific component
MSIALPRMDRLPAGERGITIADFLVPIALSERMSSTLRHLMLILAGVVLVSLSAQIRIVLPETPVPISGQTFGVLLVGGALGLRRGTASVLLYVLLGFFLPIYAEGKSGVATILSVESSGLTLGPTGGYIIGFILAAAITGWLAELGWDRRPGRALVAMGIGNIAIYLVGLPWLALYIASVGDGSINVQATLMAGFLPFIAGDLIKLLLAALAFSEGWWLVGRRPPER